MFPVANSLNKWPGNSTSHCCINREHRSLWCARTVGFHPFSPPQSWTEHRRTFGPNPCCKVHSSMEHSDLKKNLKSHDEVTGKIPHGNSTWKRSISSVRLSSGCVLGGSHRNLQDANSNRLAWKCPSPGDKPRDSRVQIPNLNRSMWNCLSNLSVANHVEEEFQGYTAGQMIKFEVSSSSFQLCPLVSSWCNQSPSWMHCDSATQPLNIHLSHLSVWRKSKQKTSQRFSVALRSTVKTVELTELLADHPPCHGEFEMRRSWNRKENQWHFWNWRLVLLTIYALS